MTPANSTKEPNESLRNTLRQRIEEESGKALSPNLNANHDDPSGNGESTTEPTSLMDLLNREIGFSDPGLAQMTAFCRQLATLIDVGVPLVQALATLAQRTEHPRLKKVVADVARRVEEGNRFSKSLEAHPRIFSHLVINVIRIGESAGILESALLYLADIMERRHALRRKVRGALAYPTAALIVCGLVILVILGFALPTFRTMYTDAGIKDMPAITEFVLSLSAVVEHHWWAIILACVVLFLGIRTFLRTSADARKFWNWFCLRMPIIRIFSVKVNVARTSRTMASLLKAGIPLLEALTITAETSENILVAEMLQKVHDNLEEGGRLEKPFREAGLFPPLVVDMLAIGGETGRLDLMFEKVAETYDCDVRQTISSLNAIIEPALILIMGSVVLILALAALLPYWQIASTFDASS